MKNDLFLETSKNKQQKMRALTFLTVAATLSTLINGSAVPKHEEGGNRVMDHDFAQHMGDEHSKQYDHEQFLGEDQAKTFDQLPPEESRRRLG
jgi:hypothetical protein